MHYTLDCDKLFCIPRSFHRDEENQKGGEESMKADDNIKDMDNVTEFQVLKAKVEYLIDIVNKLSMILQANNIHMKEKIDAPLFEEDECYTRLFDMVELDTENEFSKLEDEQFISDYLDDLESGTSDNDEFDEFEDDNLEEKEGDIKQETMEKSLNAMESKEDFSAFEKENERTEKPFNDALKGIEKLDE
jgi:hypothetical protein